MSLILSGDSGVTFPNSTVQASAGSVLQVISASLGTAQSTTSTSYVTTNLTASITPKFATSKIFVLVNGSYYYGSGTGSLYFTIYRNSTNLELTSTRGFAECNIPTSGTGQAVSMSYLDSPSTTSSTTYTAYYKSSVGNLVNFAVDGAAATITLMEVAG